MKHLVTLAVFLGLTGCAVQPVVRVSRASSDAASFPSVSAQQRGAAYAEANCAACHAVGKTGESPMLAAPHFRALGLRYPVDDLAEAFAEGIDTAHPAMPEFAMSMEENADMIVYLKSIQAGPTR